MDTMRWPGRQLHIVVVSWQDCLLTALSSSHIGPLFVTHTTLSLRHGSRSRQRQGTTAMAMEVLDLEQYLTDTLHVIGDNDDDNNHYDFTIDLCESHRKLMIRGLLGRKGMMLSKHDFDQQIRQAKLQLQWQHAMEFLDQLCAIIPTKSSSTIAGVSHEDAPYAYDLLYSSSDDIRESFHDLPPLKFFTKMAGGKKFQGKFERLLQHIHPELVSVYEHAVLMEPSKLDVLRFLVEHSSDQEEEEEEPARHPN